MCGQPYISIELRRTARLPAQGFRLWRGYCLWLLCCTKNRLATATLLELRLIMGLLRLPTLPKTTGLSCEPALELPIDEGAHLDDGCESPTLILFLLLGAWSHTVRVRPQLHDGAGRQTTLYSITTSTALIPMNSGCETRVLYSLSELFSL